ncbi:NAD(P)-dependent oxidoreductase [Variovorax sp. RCC_210]|uniref:NAD(P)-dependent oxidoreductase n=1 Tax=Variovorax sp. RCC_210 TaxID=3239217 RepID=UPI0035240C81
MIYSTATPAGTGPARRRVLVLGATGGTGRLIVAQALARGHDVHVLVRSPEKLEKLEKLEKATGLEGATVTVGDARDERALRNALRGRDAVVSALGTPASPLREVTALSESTRALVGAMRAEGVKRLVCITGMGAGDSVGHGGFFFDRVIFPALLKKVYADKNRQEALVRQSGLDWVLVRPSVLNDKASGPVVRAFTDLSGFHGGTIARADAASFVLDQLSSDAWLHRSPLVSW